MKKGGLPDDRVTPVDDLVDTIMAMDPAVRYVAVARDDVLTMRKPNSLALSGDRVGEQLCADQRFCRWALQGSNLVLRLVGAFPSMPANC